MVEKIAGRTVPDEDLENWFTYHKPTEDQIPKYLALREKAKEFAYLIRDLCPAGPDATVAIRKVREAVMVANQSIACGS